MKVKNLLKSSMLVALFSTMFAFAEGELRVGIVNFGTCVEKSYLGQDESSKLESLRNEMFSMVEAKQKEFQEVAEKLQNSDYVDALTEDAVAELENKARNLNEELQLMGNQSDQALQQAYGKMYQNIKAEIDKACEYIAREKDFDYILNKESCFYFKRPTDITQLVISELNRHYQPSSDKEEK